MAYPSFLSSCTFCHHYRRPVASLHPSSSCTTTVLLPNPCPPLSPWNARHNGGGDDVGEMQTCDWLEARWRHGGEFLHALGCNPPFGPPAISIAGSLFLFSVPRRHAEGCNRHREMVHASSKPQFSKAVRSERSPCASLIFSSSFANSSEAVLRDSPLLFSLVLPAAIKTIHRTFFPSTYIHCSRYYFISFSHGILNLFKLDCLFLPSFFAQSC